MNPEEVIVITGASAGVGRAAALAFARPGAKLALLARGKERLESARREVESRGARAIAISVDVADAAAVEKAAGEIEDALGPIDIWVNNAMTTVFSPFVEITPDEFKRATEVTYLGVVYGTLSALRRMKKRNRGVIVQVGSALAYRSIPLQSPYCGAKHAIRGFTDSLRSELIHDRSAVRLSMVQMPALNTPQFDWCKTRLPRQPQPVPPIFQPEVAARAIVWAARHPRREVWVGWPSVKAIFANKWIPGLLDRYLAKTCYSGQQTDEPIDAAQRPANLFEPVEGGYGAHGRFDSKAKSGSWEFWFRTHRPAVFTAAALLAAVLFKIFV